jgi:hypothetical protein
MFTEDMLAGKNLISMLLLVTTLVIVITVFFMAREYVSINRDKGYELRNESGKIIPSQVYILSRDGIRRLHIVINEGEREINIVVVPQERLIGIPEGTRPVFVLFDNTAFLKKSALMFTPLNEGFDKEITEYDFKSNSITFNTFQMIKSLGRKIIITKVN